MNSPAPAAGDFQSRQAEVNDQQWLDGDYLRNEPLPLEQRPPYLSGRENFRPPPHEREADDLLPEWQRQELLQQPRRMAEAVFASLAILEGIVILFIAASYWLSRHWR